jgi:hypothetical protein
MVSRSDKARKAARMDRADVLDFFVQELRKAKAEVDEIEKQLGEARQRRNEVIRGAVDVGKMRKTAIGREVDMHRDVVKRIADEERNRGGRLVHPHG